MLAAGKQSHMSLWSEREGETWREREEERERGRARARREREGQSFALPIKFPPSTFDLDIKSAVGAAPQ